MADLFKIEECDVSNESVTFTSRNKEYGQIIERILTKGLGRFDCLKVTFDSKKKASTAAANFSALKKRPRHQIGKFLSKNNVLIVKRDANVYFHALGGVKFKPEQCL